MASASSLPVARPASDPTIRVQIPIGVAPGSPFLVRLDSGESFSVICPQSSRPGDWLDIVIPHSDRGSGGGGGGGGAGELKVSKAQLGLAGAGAAAGLLLAGPLTAVALAGAGAYAASKEGSAREAGKKAFEWGSKAAAVAKDKLIEAGSHMAAEAERQRQIHNGASPPVAVAIAHPIHDT